MQSSENNTRLWCKATRNPVLVDNGLVDGLQDKISLWSVQVDDGEAHSGLNTVCYYYPLSSLHHITSNHSWFKLLSAASIALSFQGQGLREDGANKSGDVGQKVLGWTWWRLINFVAEGQLKTEGRKLVSSVMPITIGLQSYFFMNMYVIYSGSELNNGSIRWLPNHYSFKNPLKVFGSITSVKPLLKLT
jgi:hypothetical protein